MNETGIRWTDLTWNPVHGCSKTGSPGCANCYAERVSRSLDLTDHPWLETYADANVQLKPHKLDERPPEPAWVFVNSMSDLYHAAVPDAFARQVHDAIGTMPESAFQILSKHGPDDGREVPPLPTNAMLGVSVGHPDWRYRLDWLREQDARTRFVSFEPLVACIPEVDLSGIDWAIIGGESGPNYRDMDEAWARNLVRDCRRQGVAVFFKQHAARQNESGQLLDLGDGPERLEEFPELPEGVMPKPRKHVSPGVKA